jgi:hypothetical protein
LGQKLASDTERVVPGRNNEGKKDRPIALAKRYIYVRLLDERPENLRVKE